MNNEIKKVEDLEVGKYYQKEEILFMKITGGAGEDKTGTAIYFLDDMVVITDNFTPFDLAEDEAMYREITREKFEQKLQATQDRFIEMSNKVKK
jgi:hypothetical protein